MANTFDFLEVKFQELTTNVNNWVKSLYNKADIITKENKIYF